MTNEIGVKINKQLLNIKTNLTFYKVGQGIPILLIHGNGFDSSVWTEVADKLSRYFTVYSIDRNGFGGSKAKVTEGKIYSQQQATDILDFIETEINEPTVIVGWSSGALFSFQAVLADNKHFIKQIISFEAPYLASSNSDFYTVKQFIKILFLQFFNKKIEAAEKFIKLVLQKTDNTNSFDNFTNKMKHTFENNSTSTLAEIKSRTGEDIDKLKLADIRIKIDFITGELSPKFIKSANSRLAKIFPNGLWRQIDNCGHFALVEEPEKFAEIVRQLAK